MIAIRSTLFLLFGSAIVVTVAVLFSSLEPSHAKPHPATTRPDKRSVSKIDEYFAAKERYETHWQKKIERAVNYVDGVVVEVDVLLSPEVAFREEVIEYGERSVASEVESISKTWRKSDTDNHSEDNTAEESTAEESTKVFEGEESREEMAYHEPSSVKRVVERAPLIPEAVHVAIVVPRSYLKRLMQSRGKSKKLDKDQWDLAKAQLMSALECIAVALIPKAPPEQDTFPRVKVVLHD